MKTYATEFPVKTMSRVLKVSRSGYYKWLKASLLSEHRNSKLDERIEAEYYSSRSTYGSPRIHGELKKASFNVSKSTVARRMKSLGIAARGRKKFKQTTDSKHNELISPNILSREFDVSVLGTVWVSDITYIALTTGFVYLTTVMDLADRMIVGWQLSSNMTDQDTTIAAFQKAIGYRTPKKGLIFHSDRGSQYASSNFRALLKDYECVQSMSRKGNCWDNAVAESFFKTIKVEELYQHKFQSKDQVYSVVFNYIDGWYNTQRSHSSLGGLSPRQMAEMLVA